MKGHSTVEVARMVGIHKSTLVDWLKRGSIPEPKHSRIAGMDFRIWADLDVKRVLKYKEKNYCKGRGRKPKKK